MTELVPGLKKGKLLGAGHFGQVFLAEDETHRTVAVKVITPKPGEAPADWEKRRDGFKSEAQRLSRGAHDHVVKVHYVRDALDGQSACICMEYCPGGSLQTAFERGPMPIDQVRKIAGEILLGLHALHAREMIHRDIKPANILRNAKGSALLGDFGLVTDDLIMGYAALADYAYVDHLAHEVHKGVGTSVKSDIWAVGATLYRLLHGKLWYEEMPNPRFLVGKGGFADQLPWLPHVPDRWRRVIRRMMRDDTTARYQTADEAISAISSLPDRPVWDTTVEPERVRWERLKGNRVITAEWIRTPRQNQWTAWSEPMMGTKGKSMTLGGSGGVVQAKKALAGLENFLTKVN